MIRRLYHSMCRLVRTYLLPPIQSALHAGAMVARDVLLAEMQALLKRLAEMAQPRIIQA